MTIATIRAKQTWILLRESSPIVDSDLTSLAPIPPRCLSQSRADQWVTQRRDARYFARFFTNAPRDPRLISGKACGEQVGCYVVRKRRLDCRLPLGSCIDSRSLKFLSYARYSEFSSGLHPVSRLNHVTRVTRGSLWVIVTWNLPQVKWIRTSVENLARVFRLNYRYRIQYSFDWVIRIMSHVSLFSRET